MTEAPYERHWCTATVVLLFLEMVMIVILGDSAKHRPIQLLRYEVKVCFHLFIGIAWHFRKSTYLLYCRA